MIARRRRFYDAVVPRRRRLIAVVGALGLYAVPIMVYPLGGVFVWMLVSTWLAARPLRPFLRHLGAAALVVVVLL